MVNYADNTRRLAKNTVLLSFRSLFNLFCSLYSSRLILQALGVEDYGIYNAVAGFVSMFWLVTGALQTAIGRFITVSLGKGDKQELRNIFSMSFSVMLCFGILVLVLTESFGLWFLQNKMTIPTGRGNAALWVFQISVITVITSMAITPFNAEVIAHEKMGIYAYTGIAETLFRLFLALFLVYGSYKLDTLVLYAIMVMIATLSIQVFVVGYCRKFFEECRLRFYFSLKTFKEMFLYAGWHFIENISTTFSSQGVNMAINVYLGPLINSARGLAGTVENVITIFVRNFTLALSPQITKSYAARDLDYMKMLTFRGAKFSYFILLFLSLPLFLEADFALSIWLVEVPDHTANFVRLSLFISQINVIDGVFRKPQDATKDIRRYKLIISFIIFLSFPLSYLALKNGMPPESVYLITLLLAFPRIYTIQKTVSETFHYALKEVVTQLYLRMLIVTLCAASIPVWIHFVMPWGWLRTITVSVVSVICTAVSVFWIGSTGAERVFIIDQAKKVISKFNAVE